MMPTSRTVMFTDLRGSTRLYERVGNLQAAALVTGSVAQMARLVGAAGGKVIKTLGDGLMAVFAEPLAAIDAADALHESISLPAASEAAPEPLRLQIALAHGPLVEQAGDCFGDAVNVAARLLGHAGDDETLVHSALREVLDPAFVAARLRPVGALQLRGRQEKVEVDRLLPRLGGEFDSTVAASSFQSFEPAAIRLTWEGVQQTFAAEVLPLILGRGPTAQCRIDDARISRAHARIDWNGSSFELVDLSTNGTWLRFGSGGWLGLRRGHCTLHGSGSIGLGSAPAAAAGPSIDFEVLRGAAGPPR